MSQLAEQLIAEKIVAGQALSGREVSQLRPKQHIFVRGQHAVVVDVTTRGNNVELVYVKGRKAFGREQYMDIPLNASAAMSGVAMGTERDNVGDVFIY